MQNKIDKLKDLSELLNSGVITQIEFDTLKKEILESKSDSVKPQEGKEIINTVESQSQTTVKNDEEKPLMDGSCNYLKGIMNVKQGTAYLTTKRFLFGKRSGAFQAIAGPLLMHLAKGGDIIIDIEFSNLKRIEKRSHGFANKYIFSTRNGKEYALQFNRKQEQWLNSICEAAQRDIPSLKVNRLGNLIEFK
jgi:hypothetical protein